MTLTICRMIDIQKTGWWWLLLTRFPKRMGLNAGNEVAVHGHIAVSHAWRVERKAGVAMAIKQDEAAGGARALAKLVNGFARSKIGGREVAGIGRPRGINASHAGTKKIHSRLGHHDFHDGFAVAGARNATGFGVRVAPAADKRRIADAARQLATSSARGSGGEQPALAIDGDGADGSLLVPAMMLGGVFVRFALHPGFLLGFADQFFQLAELDSLLFGEALRAFRDQHHVRTILENFARELNGILDALQRGCRAGAERSAVHDYSVALDTAVEIEMRAVARVKNGIVLENHDGGFDGVQGRAAAGEQSPAGAQCAVAAGLASVHGFVRNVPRAAMNDQGWFHRDENRKGLPVCLGKRKVSEEKVQQEKKRAEREQRGSAIETTSRQPGEIADKRSGDGLETGFLAEHVKRADRRIARETAPQDGNLILEPNGKVVAIAPNEQRTRGQQEVSKKS